MVVVAVVVVGEEHLLLHHRTRPQEGSVMERRAAAAAQVKLMTLVFSASVYVCEHTNTSFERRDVEGACWRICAFVCVCVQKNTAGGRRLHLNIQFWKSRLAAGVHHSFSLAAEGRKNIKRIISAFDHAARRRRRCAQRALQIHVITEMRQNTPDSLTYWMRSVKIKEEKKKILSFPFTLFSVANLSNKKKTKNKKEK